MTAAWALPAQAELGGQVYRIHSDYRDVLEILRWLDGSADPALDRFLGQIDLLIDGPYRRELDRNQPYRGSENQRLLSLTGRYQRDLEGYYAAAGRQIELHLSERGTLMAGVPSGEQAAMWRAMPRRGEPYGMEQSGD